MADPFDRAVIAELRALMGGDLDVLLDAFRVDARQRFDHARRAWAHDDPETLRQLAHSLKGAAANLGARELSECCAALESRARDGARDGVAEALDSVEAALAACLEAFSGDPYRGD